MKEEKKEGKMGEGKKEGLKKEKIEGKEKKEGRKKPPPPLGPGFQLKVSHLVDLCALTFGLCLL